MKIQLSIYLVGQQSSSDNVYKSDFDFRSYFGFHSVPVILSVQCDYL